jgi:NAD(P)H-dependent flavin oxidoreductase YrpB (nitropropane dioxygenase family)
MITTRFTELVGCAVPIQQAGMGAVAPPELAAAVSQAGALGMLGTARPGLTVATLADLLERVRLLTDKPFGVNFIVAPIFLNGTSKRPPLDLKCIEMAARAAKVVEFFYGEPERRLVEMVHTGGALACWQVGSQAEAIAAARAGCDFIVAQGIEAGGHVRGTTPTMTLLGEVIAAVDIPVLAAGGIGSGRAMAAALAAGADGVRVGTRFVAATEAAAHPKYTAALIAAEAKDTAYTEVFSLGWPDAPHRVLRSCITAAETFQGDVVGERSDLLGTRMQILRYQVGVADQTTRGAIEAMSLWAGESVGSVKRVQPAAEIVQELAEGAERSRSQEGRVVVDTSP